MLNRLLGMLPGERTPVAELPRTPLLDDVALAIPGANPCGEDVSYDADFLRLKEEIDKLNAVDTRVDQEKAAELARQLKGNVRGVTPEPEHGTEPTANRGAAGMDADFVIASAHAVLKGKAKDLRVVSYLALGLARRDGLGGLAEGLAAYALLIESYWDDLYPPPKRMTGRKNAIEVGVRWLLEILDATTPTTTDREPLERARDSAASLTAAFAARELPDLALQMNVLDAKLGDLLARVPAPRIETVVPTPDEPSRVPGSPEAPAATAFAKYPAGAATNGTSHGAHGGATGPHSAGHAAEMVVRAATWIRDTDSRKAVPYRLTRALRWDALLAEPPHDKRKTAIEAPPASRRDYLLGLHTRGAWGELLREAETSFSQPPFHFWLDLQRLIVAALDGLGPEYTPARDMVMRELHLLVSRLPGLPALLFADGRTRFADTVTVSWLGANVAPKPGAMPNGHEVATPTRPNGGLSIRFAEPRKRFNDGDLAGALALLQRGGSEDASQHDRFRRRLYTAMLCLEASQLSVARALLEELEEAIEAHRLDRWDPALALDVWTRLYTCYATQVTRMGRGADVQQISREMQRVFAKICRVDTTRALAAAQEAGHPTP